LIAFRLGSSGNVDVEIIGTDRWVARHQACPRLIRRNRV
jgi:hypothetical protein